MSAALVRTIQHLIPVLRPGFAPGHLTPAGLAQLAGQVFFVAFEAGFGWISFFTGFYGHKRIVPASDTMDNIWCKGYFDYVLNPLVKKI